MDLHDWGMDRALWLHADSVRKWEFLREANRVSVTRGTRRCDCAGVVPDGSPPGTHFVNMHQE